jgi:hypothetical protein
VGCCILAALIIGSGMRTVTWLRRSIGEAGGGRVAIAACRSDGSACQHRGAGRWRWFVAAACMAVVAACALFAFSTERTQAPDIHGRSTDGLAERIAVLSLESICGKRAPSIAKAG